MSTRLTRREWDAVIEALIFRLAGELEEGYLPQELYDSALSKVIGRGSQDQDDRDAMTAERDAPKLTAAQRRSLAKWLGGSGAPFWNSVRFDVAERLFRAGLLATPHDLPPVNKHVCLHITPAGRAALAQEPAND